LILKQYTSRMEPLQIPHNLILSLGDDGSTFEEGITISVDILRILNFVSSTFAPFANSNLLQSLHFQTGFDTRRCVIKELSQPQW